MTTKIAAILLGVAFFLVFLGRVKDPLVKKLVRPVAILAVVGAIVFAAISWGRKPQAPQADIVSGQVREAVSVAESATPENDAACRFVSRFAPIKWNAKGRLADVSSLPNPGQSPLIIHRVERSCDGCLEANVYYGKSNWQEGKSVEIPPGKQGLLYIWYYPEKDPQHGEDHKYFVTIYSNAENCPRLIVEVPISYE